MDFFSHILVNSFNSLHAGIFCLHFDCLLIFFSKLMFFGEGSGSVVDLRLSGVAGSSLTSVTALWSLSKTHLS